VFKKKKKPKKKKKIFKKKKKKNRLDTRGFKQRKGINYTSTSTYLPTTEIDSLKNYIYH